jgi:hypothetical protein
MTRVPIKYTEPFSALLTMTGAPPRAAYLDIDDDKVRVQMGRAFRVAFPRRAVVSVDDSPHVVSVGAHGWRGRWIVNGTHRPIARIVLDEPVRARVIGVPVKLRELLVSVDDVAELERLLLG